MSTRRIDGTLFEKLVHGGLNSLTRSERELNALNVFPVADGDTGTNMRLTLENGIRCAQSCKPLNDYLKALSSGMLLGARGNSGVILSQIFKGVYLELSRYSSATAVELRNAFIRGYRVAYESVIKPVEGTILTVAREGIEQASQQQRRLNDIETLLASYIANMEISLAATPTLLPVLAEAGVVDSGGKGYLEIVRGMYEALTGAVPVSYDKPSPAFPTPSAQAPLPAAPAPDLSKFDENSDFNEGYCTEFILQLMKKPGYRQDFKDKEFLSVLEEYGESIVMVQDGMRVKVHVHTKTPTRIMDHAQQFGEFLTFKLENMQLQHNEYVEQRRAEKEAPNKTEHRLLAVIAVVNGEGMKRIFRDLGCTLILDGGPTMNTSSEEFLSAINSVDADAVVIIPNGPNMMLAAQQAVALSGADNIHLLPAKTPAEGYFALAMDVQDSTDIDMRINQMRLGISSTQTLLVAPAARDFSRRGIEAHEHDHIALCGDEIIHTSPELIDAVIGGLKRLEGFEDRETCIFFRGANVDASAEDEIRALLEDEYPLLELDFEWGGQDVYDWIIGVS